MRYNLHETIYNNIEIELLNIIFVSNRIMSMNRGLWIVDRGY